MWRWARTSQPCWPPHAAGETSRKQREGGPTPADKNAPTPSPGSPRDLLPFAGLVLRCQCVAIMRHGLPLSRGTPHPKAVQSVPGGEPGRHSRVRVVHRGATGRCAGDPRTCLTPFSFFCGRGWHRVNIGGPMTKEEEYEPPLPSNCRLPP
jgi:hypothetical protein